MVLSRESLAKPPGQWTEAYRDRKHHACGVSYAKAQPCFCQADNRRNLTGRKFNAGKQPSSLYAARGRGSPSAYFTLMLPFD
jgi:hypothetical protein